MDIYHERRWTTDKQEQLEMPMYDHERQTSSDEQKEYYAHRELVIGPEAV